MVKQFKTQLFNKFHHAYLEVESQIEHNAILIYFHNGLFPDIKSRINILDVHNSIDEI